MESSNNLKEYIILFLLFSFFLIILGIMLMHNSYVVVVSSPKINITCIGVEKVEVRYNETIFIARCWIGCDIKTLFIPKTILVNCGK